MLINFIDIDLDVLLSNYHSGDLPLGNVSHGAVRGPLALVSCKVLRCLAVGIGRGNSPTAARPRGSPSARGASVTTVAVTTSGEREQSEMDTSISTRYLIRLDKSWAAHKRLQCKTEEHVA